MNYVTQPIPAGKLDGGGGSEQLNFPPVKTRWIRMRALKRATPFGVSLWEFRVTGDASVPL